jgi:3-phenylpropionate/trans-cinnamate dioxygenase ferredoxin subunit
VANFVKVAEVGELAPGDVKGVEVDGVQVALVNLEGAYYALADECSHRGGYLSEGDVDGDLLFCPVHAGSFDIRTGRPVDSPPVEPVATYPVRIEGSEIQVDVGNRE